MHRADPGPGGYSPFKYEDPTGDWAQASLQDAAATASGWLQSSSVTTLVP